jgi:hypothetical protein
MAVAVTALVAALGGVAIASPIGGDGKVHLCYSQAGVDAADGNQVVAVNAGSPCPAEYPQSLVLNQTGPAGAPGPTGAPGPQGPGGTNPKLTLKTAQDALKQLQKADKIADKSEDKLRKLEEAIERAKDDATQQEELALWHKQQRMVEMIQQITDAITQLANANRQVIRDLR